MVEDGLHAGASAGLAGARGAAPASAPPGAAAAAAAAGAAAGTGGGRGGGGEGSARTTPDQPTELELALDAAARVNRHLNQEIEAVLLSLRAAEEERAAWAERARWLARKLTDERRWRRRPPSGGDGGGEAEDDDEEGAVLREAIQQQQQQQQMQQQQQQQDAAEAAIPPQQQQQQQQEQLLAREAWDACAPQRRALVAAGRAAGWLARRGDIALGDRLGEGAFGVTYRCVWRGADAVAKRLRPPATAAEALNFLREVRCLAAVRHPHVVPFLGAVLEQGPGELWLLSEYMPGGNMADWLRGKRSTLPQQHQQPVAAYTRPPPLADRLSAALDVARGLAALAAAAPVPIMHRDVKPSNVFIDAGGRARLGDFGLARPCPGLNGGGGGGGGAEEEEQDGGRRPPHLADPPPCSSSAADVTGETGTYAYMAPEVVRHEAYDGPKADAWSFGVLLVEAATLERPYEHERLTPVQIALGVADERLRPWIPAALLPPAVAVLAGALCDFDPAMRPDWAFAVAELDEAVRELRRQRQGGASVGGGDGNKQQSTSSWLLSRLLGGVEGGLGVPPSWLPVLGSAAAAAAASRPSLAAA